MIKKGHGVKVDALEMAMTHNIRLCPFLTYNMSEKGHDVKVDALETAMTHKIRLCPFLDI